MERASGVLMPVSSLPGPYGIGGFGWNAYDFVDFLASCKQHYWQILPLTTTSYGDSPYQSFSARAATPISLTLPSLSRPAIWSSEISTACTWAPTPAMLTMAPSLVAVVRFSPRRRTLCRRQAGRLRRLCPNQQRLAHPLLRVHDRQGGVRSQGILGVARGAPYPRRGFCQGLRRPSRAHALPPDDAVLLRSSVESPQGLCQRARHPHHRRPAHLCLARLRRDVGHARAL